LHFATKKLKEKF